MSGFEYKLTGENFVIRLAAGEVPEMRIPIMEYVGFEPNKNPEYLAYKKWLADGGVPLPSGVSECPAAVEMRQARLALFNAGLLPPVEANLEGAARIEWDTNPTVRRDHWLVAQLAAILELSDAEVDALFIQAAAIP